MGGAPKGMTAKGAVRGLEEKQRGSMRSLLYDKFCAPQAMMLSSLRRERANSSLYVFHILISSSI